MTVPRDVLDRVEVLRGRPCQVTELPGGLTNRNYKVTADGSSYVVRMWSSASGALPVDREHEYRNSLLAARSGVGAPVLAYLPDQCALVIGFLEGETLTDHSFSVPGTIGRVAEACRRLHRGPRFCNDFDMAEIQRRYLRIVLDGGFRLPAGYLELDGSVERIRRVLAASGAPTVPCNNDLLAANFIDAGDRIHVIDYEYSGNNDPCFELGNLWSECHLADDQLGELVEAYFGELLEPEVARARLQAVMSQYGWTLWASIQDATSDIAFDFWAWGLEKYERAVRTLRSRDLDRLLDAAGKSVPGPRPERGKER